MQVDRRRRAILFLAVGHQLLEVAGGAGQPIEEYLTVFPRMNGPSPIDQPLLRGLTSVVEQLIAGERDFRSDLSGRFHATGLRKPVFENPRPREVFRDHLDDVAPRRRVGRYPHEQAGPVVPPDGRLHRRFRGRAQASLDQPGQVFWRFEDRRGEVRASGLVLAANESGPRAIGRHKRPVPPASEHGHRCLLE